MAFVKTLISLIKKLSILILIISILIPLRYGSTNVKHLRIRCFHSILSLVYNFVPDEDRPTLSADYRAFEALLRLKPLSEFDPLADPIAVVKEVRSAFSFGLILPKPQLCEVTKHIYSNEGHTVDAYWINYHQLDKQFNTTNVVLYFHGGAYIVGDIHSYSGFECHLSRLLNVSVIHLEYRLAPENPLPAAVDDAVALYNSLIREHLSPSKIIIMGDSAGGGLSLLTVQSLISKNISIPAGIVAISPWTDLSSSGQSYVRNRLTDAMLRHESVSWGVKHVLGTKHHQLNTNDSMFSPLFGSFKGFPPVYVTVGTAELLEDDSRQVVDKFKEVDVNVTFEEGLHLAHVYPLFHLYYPEARKTLENIQKWVEHIYQ